MGVYLGCLTLNHALRVPEFVLGQHLIPIDVSQNYDVEHGE